MRLVVIGMHLIPSQTEDEDHRMYMSLYILHHTPLVWYLLQHLDLVLTQHSPSVFPAWSCTI